MFELHTRDNKFTNHKKSKFWNVELKRYWVFLELDLLKKQIPPPFWAKNIFVKIYIIIYILIITASFKKEVDQEEKRTLQNHNKNRCNLIWTNWQQMIYSVSYYNIHLQVLCTCSNFCSFIKFVHGLVVISKVYTEK